MAYKKNDIIRFMTNQPGVHAMEMFGHCEFNPDEIEKEEYIGRIKSVVANGASYVVSTISPSSSFNCVADAEEVLGQLQEIDLTEEQREGYHKRLESHEAPNVYDNDPSDLDESLTIEQKCEVVASKAMKALFPEAVTRGYDSFGIYDFRMETYLNDLHHCLEGANDKSETRKAELKEKCKKLEAWFRKQRFKEYYTICVGVEVESDTRDLEIEKTVHKMLTERFGKEEADKMHNPNPKTVFRNWLVAVDLNFEEVSIMRDGQERSRFFMFLGGEHDDLYHAKIAFAQECIK